MCVFVHEFVKPLYYYVYFRRQSLQTQKETEILIFITLHYAFTIALIKEALSRVIENYKAMKETIIKIPFSFQPPCRDYSSSGRVMVSKAAQRRTKPTKHRLESLKCGVPTFRRCQVNNAKTAPPTLGATSEGFLFQHWRYVRALCLGIVVIFGLHARMRHAVPS